MVSLRKSISILDESGSQIVLVVKNNKLIGTITDGDVRRALLRGYLFDTPVKNIMNKNFIYLNQSSSENDALHLMRKKTIKQIPVLNNKGSVTKLFLMDELIKSKTLPYEVVIMAGGEGKRLGDLTKNCPKPMLKINGKPILEVILEQCIDLGLRKFYFSVRYLKNQIKHYFKDGSKWDVNIKYLEENKSLGTAGSLSLLKKKFTHPVLVLNGDVLTKVNLNKLFQFHNKHGADISICVRKHVEKIPYGIVNLDDLNVLSLEEKPEITNFINAGIYVLDPKIFKLVPKNTFFDMPELIKNSKKKNYKINGFPIHEYWQDIGYPVKLFQTIKDWK